MVIFSVVNHWSVLVIRQHRKNLEKCNLRTLNFGTLSHQNKGFRHELERVEGVILTRFSISSFKSVTKWEELTRRKLFLEDNDG
jgi:hypothetical protein